VTPVGACRQLIDDLVEERLDGVQQTVEDRAELGRGFSGCQRGAVGAQVRGGKGLLRQGVLGAKGLRVTLGPSMQVVRRGGPGVVGGDLFVGAADVVVQLEVRVQRGFLSPERRGVYL
jgi:hypothetical protein